MLANACYPRKVVARRCCILLGVALLAVTSAAAAASSRPVEWSRLSSEHQRLVEPVVAHAHVHREVDGIVYPARRDVWEFLLDYPEFAADVARALREGKYRVRRVGDHYEAADGRGVTGVMRPVYVEPGRRVFHLDGRYDSRWFPTLKGRAVLVVDSDYLVRAGVPHADVRVIGYLRIDSALVSSLMTIARDLSGRTVDRKVRRFFGHVERITKRASEDPHGMLDQLGSYPNLDRQRLAQFRRVLLGDATAGPAR